MYSRVAAVAGTASVAALPLTGGDVLPFVAAAIGLMFAGLLMLRIRHNDR